MTTNNCGHRRTFLCAFCTETLNVLTVRSAAEVCRSSRMIAPARPAFRENENTNHYAPGNGSF